MLQVSELSGRHDKASFDCGSAELNNYLQLPDRPLTLFLPIARVKGATARAKR